jgi:hypothetical protein
MLLQSHRSFHVLAEFDPATGAFETFSKSDVSDVLATKGKDGTFDYLNSHRIVLYRSDKELVVQVDDLAAAHQLGRPGRGSFPRVGDTGREPFDRLDVRVRGARRARDRFDRSSATLRVLCGQSLAVSIRDASARLQRMNPLPAP